LKKRIVLLFFAIAVFSGSAGFGGASIAIFLNGRREAVPLSGNITGNSAADARNEHYSDETFGFLSLNDLSEIQNRAQLTIPQIAAKVSDSVVEIETEKVVNSSRFRQYTLGGAGSGVIISADGYIVTCNHVIADVSKILVRLKNGTEYEARLIGRDTKTDLAVIKISASGLNASVFGNSNSLVVGELAVAVGNPLGELGGTVTEGIISALNRDINIDDEVMNLLQTSAAVNPGNSGGALFNSYGELIGIVNSKSGGSNIEGIGFAIPSNVAKSIAEQLIQNGYVAGRVDFGIALVDINDTWTAMRYGLMALGVYVARDDKDSGLKSGDRVVSVNGAAVNSAADVKTIYDKYKVGDVLELVISRSGKEMKANVKLKQALN
jgi:serine protease Do